MNMSKDFEQHSASPIKDNREQYQPIGGSMPDVGAFEIVEAFTALRHELKLQVRSGRELQQAMQELVLRTEGELAQPRALQVDAKHEQLRQTVEALTEIEESLSRAVLQMSRASEVTESSGTIAAKLETHVRSASWFARFFAGRSLKNIANEIRSFAERYREIESTNEGIHQGLRLLLSRTHRCMQMSQIERIDVLHEPFDAELMHAMDIVEAPGIASQHVAEQIRPAYRWCGKVLKYAEVRLAK